MRPIILIPGFGGSILVNKQKPSRKIVHRQMLHNRWLNVYPFIPKSIDQWKHDMHCTIVKGDDNKVKRVIPACNDITTYDVGGTHGIKDVLPEFLLLPDSFQEVMQSSFQFRYYHDMCEACYSVGYKDHETLFGIPYDFRLVLDPEYRINFFTQIKHILEEAFHKQKQSSVVVTHSLGALMFKWFMSSAVVDNDWLQKHVHYLYMLSAPFGGSLYALKTVLYGDFYIPQFHAMYKNELQTNTGIIMCLPNELGFEPIQRLVEVDESDKHITLQDYATFYDEGHVSFQIWNDLYRPYMDLICSYNNVPCHVINATNKATPHTYKVRNDVSYPYFEYNSNEGDGIILSLRNNILENMFPKEKLQVTTLKDCKHTHIISHPVVVRNILECALSDEK